MKLYGYRVSQDNDGFVYYLSCDDGWLYSQYKEDRRNWDPTDGPILIELFEVEVDLSDIETEEYFRGARTADDVREDISDVEKRIMELERKKSDLLRELVS